MGVDKLKIAVIGGGAAGLMAAVAAAEEGAGVTILERNPKVGRKILATGNGRCNYTNTESGITRFHGKDPRFALGALKRFDNQRTIGFFENLGIVPRVEERGKVFPRSGQASSVLDVLRFELERLGAATICDCEVTALDKDRDGFVLRTAAGREYTSEKVIIAAGGRASPNLGSNGSGFTLAEELGHTLIEPFPALVQVKLRAGFLKQTAGIKFNGTAAVEAEGKVLARDRGEILFTTYGVSGPPVLQVSRRVWECLRQGITPFMTLNLVDDMTREELEAFLTMRLAAMPSRPLDLSFVGFINKQLAPVLLKEAGIEDIRKPAGQVTAAERSRIADLLQNWRLEITATLPWSQAQVTAGGIATGEIDPRTMESRLVPGLFFAGEVIDIDGDSGGFNLQWAWASGWIAGKSVSRSS